jgi:hypothetical protein
LFYPLAVGRPFPPPGNLPDPDAFKTLEELEEDLVTVFLLGPLIFIPPILGKPLSSSV